MKTATLRAEAIPSIFQFPSWGTPAWEETYAKRTNVERGLFDFHLTQPVAATKLDFSLLSVA